MTTETFLEFEKKALKEVNEKFGDEGWDLKQYVLILLFYRYLSENITRYIDSNQKKTNSDINDYSLIDDETAYPVQSDIVGEIGYFIPPSQLFANLAKSLANDAILDSLNEILSNIFNNIENSTSGTPSEKNFRGLFADFDVNSEMLGNTVKKRNTRIKEFINLVSNWKLDLGSEHQYGQLFESLIGNFAAKAGKKGGKFFTPKEVSELMVALSLINNKVKRIYDPACGSGSLLLKYSKMLDNDKTAIEYFGQDENLTFYNFCRINMLLHDVNFDFSFIEHGDTLENPKHLDEVQFDAIVSNPEFSKKWKGKSNSLYINDSRFSPAGVLAPEGRHDMAFIMHALYLLNANGAAVLAEHPGVMYRGKTEQKIRKYLIENNYIDSVIQLPPDLFFGVPIASNLLILRKSRKITDVFFVNVGSYFQREGSKNKLTPANVADILEIVRNRSDIDYVACNVSQETIRKNKYLLTVSSYVRDLQVREEIDIKGLNSSIKEIVRNQNLLRNSIDLIVEEMEDATSE